MVLFTHIVKQIKIKDAAYKNDDIDGTCKRTLCVGPYPFSGAVWKILHKTIQPIRPCFGPGPGHGQCD